MKMVSRRLLEATAVVCAIDCVPGSQAANLVVEITAECTEILPLQAVVLETTITNVGRQDAWIGAPFLNKQSEAQVLQIVDPFQSIRRLDEVRPKLIPDCGTGPLDPFENMEKLQAGRHVLRRTLVAYDWEQQKPLFLARGSYQLTVVVDGNASNTLVVKVIEAPPDQQVALEAFERFRKREWLPAVYDSNVSARGAFQDPVFLRELEAMAWETTAGAYGDLARLVLADQAARRTFRSIVWGREDLSHLETAHDYLAWIPPSSAYFELAAARKRILRAFEDSLAEAEDRRLLVSEPQRKIWDL